MAWSPVPKRTKGMRIVLLRCVSKISLTILLALALSTPLLGVAQEAASDSAAAPAQPDFQALIEQAVREGIPVDQAMQSAAATYPEHLDQVVAAAMAVLNGFPTWLCDECYCGAPSSPEEYTLKYLEEEVEEREDWTPTVISRFTGSKSVLMLPLLEDRAYAFFYHYIEPLERLRNYLKDEDEEPEKEKVQAFLKQLREEGLQEPVHLVVSSAFQGGARLREEQEFLIAAEMLGMKELPVRFAFTDCGLCAGFAESSFYDLDELARHPHLQWVADRYFDELELLFVDRPHTGPFPFKFHVQMEIPGLLTHFPKEDPPDEQVEEWMERIKNMEAGKTEDALDSPLEIDLYFSEKRVRFEDEAHAQLIAAQRLGWTRFPVLLSWLDEMGCRMDDRRPVYLSAELYPFDRIPVVRQRFSESNKRLVFEEYGMYREIQKGYPFGETFPYHLMVKVDELLAYIEEDEMPDDDVVEDMMEEIRENAITDPVYISLKKKEEVLAYEEDSDVLVVAAKRLGFDHLPVRILYIDRTDRRRRSGCILLFREQLCQDMQYECCNMVPNTCVPAGPNGSCLNPPCNMPPTCTNPPCDGTPPRDPDCKSPLCMPPGGGSPPTHPDCIPPLCQPPGGGNSPN